MEYSVALLNALSAVCQEKEMALLAGCSRKTEVFGLTLTEDEAKELIQCRNDSLKKHRRVEFGQGILDKLMYAFCDSDFISPDTWLDTLKQLQDIFYDFKNQTGDQVTDEELITFMKEQFDGVCMGDMEYLESTCLDRFAHAVRSGYRGHEATGGKGEYEALSEETHWDPELYLLALGNQF